MKTLQCTEIYSGRGSSKNRWKEGPKKFASYGRKALLCHSTVVGDSTMDVGGEAAQA